MKCKIIYNPFNYGGAINKSLILIFSNIELQIIPKNEPTIGQLEEKPKKP